MKLLLVIIASFAVALALMFSELSTAKAIAKAQSEAVQKATNDQ